MQIYRVDTPDGHVVSTGETHWDAANAALQHQAALGRLGCPVPSSGSWYTIAPDGERVEWRVALSKDGVLWAVLMPTAAGS